MNAALRTPEEYTRKASINAVCLKQTRMSMSSYQGIVWRQLYADAESSCKILSQDTELCIRGMMDADKLRWSREQLKQIRSHSVVECERLERLKQVRASFSQWRGCGYMDRLKSKYGL
jgi:hypothetical protein